MSHKKYVNQIRDLCVQSLHQNGFDVSKLAVNGEPVLLKNEESQKSYEQLQLNCCGIASASSTPAWENNVKAYLQGKMLLSGASCSRTFSELMDSIETQVNVGVNPDLMEPKSLTELGKLLLGSKSLTWTTPVALQAAIDRLCQSPHLGKPIQGLQAQSNNTEQTVKLANCSPALQNRIKEHVRDFFTTYNPITQLSVSQAREVMENNCALIASRSQPTDVFDNIAAYLNGTRNLYGKEVCRSMGDLFQSILVQVATGSNPDEPNQTQPASIVESVFDKYMSGPDQKQPQTVINVHVGSQELYRFYRDDEEYIVTREYGIAPNQLPHRGNWVMRDFNTGEYIDHDKYINDLSERNYFKIDRS